MSRSKRDPDFLPLSRAKEEARKLKLAHVMSVAENMLASTDGINRADDLRKRLSEECSIKVSSSYIRQVLRHDLGCRYRRIKKVPYHGNSPRCLILRQHYALFMLEQLARGTRVINIDQSWLGESCFQRQRWRRRG